RSEMSPAPALHLRLRVYIWISVFTVLIFTRAKGQRGLAAKLAASALLVFILFTPSGTALAQSFSAPTSYSTAENPLIGAVGDFNGDANQTARAQAVRMVAEDQDLYNAEFNRAFVLAQYFGYLRRNPNDAPDSDYTGYD